MVTAWIIIFLSGCIVALLKVVCIALQCCEQKELDWEERLQHTRSNEIANPSWILDFFPPGIYLSIHDQLLPFTNIKPLDTLSKLLSLL